METLMTVFTPTFNRVNTLHRVYNSLLIQTNMSFVWLIVDDGSNDNTKQLIDKWIDDGLLKIFYFYKPNGGKYTAMQYGFSLVKTKYVLPIDSDDELDKEAVEIFLNMWREIENKYPNSDFESVNALTNYKTGGLVGNYTFKNNNDIIDSTWQEMNLKYHNYNENIKCFRTDRLIEAMPIDEDFWMSDKFNYILDSVFWARLGRKSKSRFINKVLRYYYTDELNRLSLSSNKKFYYTNLVSYKYFLDENVDYTFYDIRYFSVLYLKLIIAQIETGTKSIEVLKHIHSFKSKVIYFIFIPLGYFSWIFFKIFRPKYLD